MKIHINGKAEDVPGGLTVSGLLVDRKVKMADMVSVELNGEILDRNTFDSTMVSKDDRIEFLYFMGGGARAAEIHGSSFVPAQERDQSSLDTCHL